MKYNKSLFASIFTVITLLGGLALADDAKPRIKHSRRPPIGGIPTPFSLANIPTPSINFARFFTDPGLFATTREFGNSVISMKNLPYHSQVAKANQTPWSAWFYPDKDDLLFKDQNSTLAKYDMFRRSKYRKMGKQPPGSAQLWAKSKFHPELKEWWEGKCDARALAAISRPEPKRPVTFYGERGESLTFGISDLKALLLMTYEGVEDEELGVYGQKFTGDQRGSVWDDPFPNEFHRFLEVFLFERHQAFMMDYDPSPQVWMVPVYETNHYIEAVPGDPNSVAVTAWLYSAESTTLEQRDDVGMKRGMRTYHYILHGYRNADNDLVVYDGEWAVGSDGIDSQKSHPDFMTVVKNPMTLVRKSNNPEIEIDIVDEILLKAY